MRKIVSLPELATFPYAASDTGLAHKLYHVVAWPGYEAMIKMEILVTITKMRPPPLEFVEG